MSQPTLSDSALKELISSSDANTKGHTPPVLEGDEDHGDFGVCPGEEDEICPGGEDEICPGEEDEICPGGEDEIGGDPWEDVGGEQEDTTVGEQEDPAEDTTPDPLEILEDIFLDIAEEVANSEAVCENKSEEIVALALPTAHITQAADKLIENATADNMYSVYKIMDCDDEYTTGSQKVFLAAATATTISTVMVATKALLGSYHTFNGLTDRVNELEAKLAATEEDLEECEVTLEVQEVENEEQKEEIEEQKAEIAEQDAEIDGLEEEIEEQKAEIAEQDAEIDGLEESLAAAAAAGTAALELVDQAAEIMEAALGIDSDAECEAELVEKDEEIEGLEESLANAAIAGNAALENVQKLEEILDHLEEDVQEAMEIVDDTEAILEDALGLGDESRLEDEEITA